MASFTWSLRGAIRSQPGSFVLKKMNVQVEVEIRMDRPTRVRAGVPAPHFSQDELLSSIAVGGKRQRGAVIPPCQHCARVHRSDQEKDKCERAAEPTCG